MHSPNLASCELLPVCNFDLLIVFNLTHLETNYVICPCILEFLGFATV